MLYIIFKTTSDMLKNIIAPILFLSSLVLSSQSSVIWQKTYGGNDLEYIRGGTLPTKSGGYIIAGHSSSGKSGNKTISNTGVWLIGIDDKGSILWQRGYCVAGSLASFKSLSDGNYILCISTDSDTCENKSRKSMLTDIWLVKINDVGDILWEKTISGLEYEQSPVLITTQDNGFLIGVESYSSVGLDKTEFLYGVSDYWVIKLDSLGNIEWDKTIGGSKQDGVNALVELADGYIVGGYSGSGVAGTKTVSNFGRSDYWIVKLTKDGRLRWQKVFGGDATDYLTSLLALKDKGLMICGHSTSADTSGNKTTPNLGKEDWWIIRLDSLGNQVWQKSYGGSNSEGSNPINIIPSGESEFYLFGSSLSGVSGNKTTPSQGNSDFWILKLNSEGDILKQYSFGGDAKDVLTNLYPETDSTFILSGESWSTISGDKSEAGYGSQDIWVLKVKLGQTITATNNNEISSIKIYPNPTRDIINFNSDIEINQAAIINLYGQAFHHNLIGNNSIDVSKLFPGAYFIKLIDKKGNCVHKEMISKF